MTASIRKAVFPVAGLGTRFLPATKASPKEMLPIVDKPLIQYAVEEAVAAGVEVLVFITGRNKRAIADHFDRAYELETELEAKGKKALLDTVRGIVPPSVTCVYIRQNETLGLGHAVLCARPVIGDEPFYVILADDLIDAARPCVDQMRSVHERTGGCSVLAVQDVPGAETGRYGIVEVDGFDDRSGRVTGIVEKPDPASAPSTLGVVGRYVLTPGIFEHLISTPTGAGGEFQLTDAIAGLLQDESVHAYRFEGTRFDCGSKLGYLQATVVFGQKHPQTGPEFTTWLKSIKA